MGATSTEKYVFVEGKYYWVYFLEAVSYIITKKLNTLKLDRHLYKLLKVHSNLNHGLE